jgi:predicted SAM-dependent methyltransferase
MRLHIGGEQAKEGWKILNAASGPYVDFVGDICNLSQFEADSCDEIYASHVFEHVGQHDALPCLQGIHRVLKTGGRFMVSVPDLDILCRYFIDPRADLKVKIHVMRMMFGGQVNQYDYHYMGWNEVILQHFLQAAGFSAIMRVSTFGLFDDTSNYAPYGEPISLNVVATK